MSAVELNLPSREDLELTDYKLGSATSDLDFIRRRVERCLEGEVTTLEEYQYRKSEGFEHPGGESPDYSQDELARLVVFATAVLRDAESIERDAQAIQQAAIDLYYEQGPAVDWDTRNALVKAWHSQEASDGDA